MTKILIACMPKSGSSYLSEAIGALPDFKKVVLVPDHERREQELSRSMTSWWAEQETNWVAQQHTRMSAVTEGILEDFAIKPVVLVRNIYDVVPSLMDHHAREGTAYPMAYTPPSIVEWPQEDAAMFIARMVLPWYFNFFMSWQERADKIMVRYEDFLDHPVQTVRDILEFSGHFADDEQIERALTLTRDVSPRRNKIRKGRGQQLPDSVKSEIDTMARFYADVDLSPMGISH